MPSPVGHAIAGIAVHALVSRAEADLLSPRRMGVAVAAALAPDLDLLFYWIDGRNHHQQESHSIGVAAALALLALALFRSLRWSRPGRLALSVGLGWISHLLLDYLNQDSNPPIGLLALWPGSRAYYKFPWPIFLEVGRTLSWHTAFQNLLAAGWEAAVLLPLLALVLRVRFRGLDGRSEKGRRDG